MSAGPVGEGVTKVHNHWWWRPGWSLGRHFLACHLTFEDATELHRLVDRYQEALREVPNLDLIPRRWLHLTMRGIGFVDQLSQDQVRQLRRSIGDALQNVPPIDVTFSDIVVRPEAVYLPAHPASLLVELHSRIGQAIESALGPGKCQEPPEQATSYRPHVSVGYVNADGPAQPIRDALATAASTTANVRITEVPLLVFNRDHRMYQWTGRDPIPLGTSKRAASGGTEPIGRTT